MLYGSTQYFEPLVFFWLLAFGTVLCSCKLFLSLELMDKDKDKDKTTCVDA
jgi:hypothetical protein